MSMTASAQWLCGDEVNRLHAQRTELIPVGHRCCSNRPEVAIPGWLAMICTEPELIRLDRAHQVIGRGQITCESPHL
jgi:hypothetical protein